jgi:hypothetical protein
LINPNTVIPAEQLPGIIRERFLLQEQVVVTPGMITAYTEACSTGDFTALAGMMGQNRNDRFSIHLTHDIDWLYPGHPYSVLKYLRSLVSSSPWYDLRVMTKHDALLKNIERMMMLEADLQVSSIFFMGAGEGGTTGRYDIRYTVHNGLFKELVSLLRQYHHPAGLHSSYNADEQNRIAHEKHTLEHYISMAVDHHRSHFLHYDPDTLYTQLDKAGFRYDLGLGKARVPGLAGNFPGSTRPVNKHTGEVHRVTLVPLILMDNAFFHMSYHDVIKTFNHTLDQLERSGGSACILFHPENMLLKPELWDHYTNIIHLCKQHGALISPHF